jgi:hypothetical protein
MPFAASDSSVVQPAETMELPALMATKATAAETAAAPRRTESFAFFFFIEIFVIPFCFFSRSWYPLPEIPRQMMRLPCSFLLSGSFSLGSLASKGQELACLEPF